MSTEPPFDSSGKGWRHQLRRLRSSHIPLIWTEKCHSNAPHRLQPAGTYTVEKQLRALLPYSSDFSLTQTDSVSLFHMDHVLESQRNSSLCPLDYVARLLPSLLPKQPEQRAVSLPSRDLHQRTKLNQLPVEQETLSLVHRQMLWNLVWMWRIMKKDVLRDNVRKSTACPALVCFQQDKDLKHTSIHRLEET